MSKRWSELRIPTSTPDELADAASFVASWRSWPAGHVLHGWLHAAKVLIACYRSGQWPGDLALGATEDQGAAEFATRVMSPAFRLCRLDRALRALPQLAGSVDEELELLLAAPPSFHHAEVVLHLATGLAELLDTPAAIVPRSDDEKRPDFDLPALRVSFEVKAKEEGNPDGTHKKVFRSATRKFRAYLADKPGWRGVMALDLGFRGSPSLPSIGGKGPDLVTLERNLSNNLNASPDAALVLMNTVALDPPEAPEASIRPVETSFLVFADRKHWVSPELESCFHTEPDRSRVALRRRE